MADLNGDVQEMEVVVDEPGAAGRCSETKDGVIAKHARFEEEGKPPRGGEWRCEKKQRHAHRHSSETSCDHQGSENQIRTQTFVK